MLFLSQASWSTSDAEALQLIVSSAAAEAGRQSAAGQPEWILLLPHSPLAVRETEAFATLAAAAKQNAVYLAGSILASSGEQAPATLGFLFGPDGAQLLRVGKLTPDLVEGFGDTQALPAAQAEFPVAKLPFAQVGILPGEDILIAQYARALSFNGAELILNPCIERTDKLLEARRMSRWGRATDAAGYVASASPAEINRGGVTMRLPTATALYNWEREVIRAQGGETLIRADLDIELLRRKRSTPMGSMPAIVRANVYGIGYTQAAAEDGALPAPATRTDWLAEAERRIAAEAKRCGPALPKYEEQYDICVIQSMPRLIPLGVDNAREIILRNLDESLALAGSRANIPSVRLVVFPEFWLTGPGGIGGIQRTVRDMEKMAISAGDEVFEKIGNFARTNNVYVAFQNFEVHEKLPGRVFNSAFLISDTGELIHTYRKNQCADVWGFLPDTTPGSLLDQYIEIFGYDALFPVADTPIGKLANMICFDNMSPEVAYGLRRAGAEVILHSSSEPHGAEGRAPWDNQRRLRAWENSAYVLSALDGGEHVADDSEHLTFFRRGHTRIVNFDGTIQGVVDGPGPVVLRGHIDLAALRRQRADPRANLALWNDAAAYQDNYNGDIGFPNNLWSGDPYENPYLGAAQLRARIDNYVERGIYVAPTSELGSDRYRTSDQV